MHRKPIGRTDDVQVLNKLNAMLGALGRQPLADRTVGGADLHAVEVDTWRHLDEQVEAERHEAPADAG